MKKYIEATEQGESENLDFIQEEIDINYNDDKIKELKDKVTLKQKIGKLYNYTIHTCLHNEHKSCIREKI